MGPRIPPPQHTRNPFNDAPPNGPSAASAADVAVSMPPLEQQRQQQRQQQPRHEQASYAPSFPLEASSSCQSPPQPPLHEQPFSQADLAVPPQFCSLQSLPSDPREWHNATEATNRSTLNDSGAGSQSQPVPEAVPHSAYLQQLPADRASLTVQPSASPAGRAAAGLATSPPYTAPGKQYSFTALAVPQQPRDQQQQQQQQQSIKQLDPLDVLLLGADARSMQPLSPAGQAENGNPFEDVVGVSGGASAPGEGAAKALHGAGDSADKSDDDSHAEHNKHSGSHSDNKSLDGNGNDSFKGLGDLSLFAEVGRPRLECISIFHANWHCGIFPAAFQCGVLSAF